MHFIQQPIFMQILLAWTTHMFKESIIKWVLKITLQYRQKQDCLKYAFSRIMSLI